MPGDDAKRILFSRYRDKSHRPSESAANRSYLLSRVPGPGFVFREHGYPMAYGLVVSNPSTTPMMRAMLMAVQAHILRTLLFDSASLKLPKSW